MQTETGLNFFQTLKAAIIAVACALVLTVTFAVVLKFSSLPDKIILPVNLCIKAISVLVGCLCALRGEKGWLRGGIAGLIFTFLSGLLFSFVGGGASFSWLLIVEVLFGFVAGALAGIFAVNIKGD